jgi:hypothetical protein
MPKSWLEKGNRNRVSIVYIRLFNIFSFLDTYIRHLSLKVWLRCVFCFLPLYIIIILCFSCNLIVIK